MLRFVRSTTSSVFGRDQSVTLSYSVSPDTSPALQAAGRAMCAYVCSGRPYVEENLFILVEHLTKILSEPGFSFTAVADEDLEKIDFCPAN